jgi:PAS domain S-box-containing protein
VDTGEWGLIVAVPRVAPFSSLRVRLLALVLVAILPAAAILFWTDRNQRALLVEAVHDEAHDLALLVAERHHQAVARARGLLVALARHPSLRAHDGRTCSAELALILKEDPLYSNLAGVDRSGNMFCSAVPLSTPINIADRRHVRAPLDRGEFGVGGYIRSRARPGVDAFGFGSAVRDATGNVIAVAIATFDLAWLQRDLEDLPLPDGAEVIVVDANDVVLTGLPAPGARIGTRLPPRLIGGGAEVQPVELDGLDGVRRIYAYEDVNAGHEIAMRVVAGIPVATARAPLQRITRGSLFALLAVGAFALVYAGLTGEILLVRKLEAVTAAARRLARGDPTARTGLDPRRGGEMGALAGTFDEMAATLQALTRQNRLLLDAVGEGIVGIGDGGLITFANPAAARALGWSVEEMLGKDAHALMHPRRADGSAIGVHECRIQAAMRDNVTQRGAGEVLWRRDGSSFAVEFVSTPLVDGARTVGAVLVFTDVSERRRLEERLRHAEKMEAVGQLAGGVAHDFNNLLTAIVSYAALVRDALGSDHPSVPDVREIEAAAMRAAGLTRQLLAFSRRQRVAPQMVDLHGVVAGMERMLRRVLPENVELTVVAHAPGTVFADPAQLEVVILNLAVNARDALPRGGRIEITVFEVEEGASDLGDGETPAGRLAVLQVRDDGVGMDATTRARIFEPFFTTKPAGKGTGLGLATVYGIVSQAGGEIRVRSEPGRGSEFRVYLPRWSGVAAPAPATAPASPARGDETVLVVEDDAAIRALVRRTLAQAGYRVLDASTADQALAVAVAPDVLVTDVILPGRNGWELATALATRRPGLRVLFMSGYAAHHSGEPLVPADAPLLAKPFAPEELLRRVREVLDGDPQDLAATAKRSA